MHSSKIFLKTVLCLCVLAANGKLAIPAQNEQWTIKNIAEKLSSERQKLQSGLVWGEGWQTRKQKDFSSNADWEPTLFDSKVELVAAFDCVHELMYFDYRGYCGQKSPLRVLQIRQSSWEADLMLLPHRGTDELKLSKRGSQQRNGFHSTPDFRVVGLGDFTNGGGLGKWIGRFENQWNLKIVEADENFLTLLEEHPTRRLRFKIDVKNGFTIVERNDEWNPPNMEWRTQDTASGEFETISRLELRWKKFGDTFCPISIKSTGYAPTVVNGQAIETDPNNLRLKMESVDYSWNFRWSEVNQRQDTKMFEYKTLNFDRPTEVYGVDRSLIEIVGPPPIKTPEKPEFSR